MITAVDTNILLDIFSPDEKFSKDSLRALKAAYDQGALMICDIVYAELVPHFKRKPFLDDTLETLNITMSSLNKEIAFFSRRKVGAL